jgi:hypothetical protein
MKKLQTIGRILYRSFVVAMLFLIHNPDAIYGVPMGLIIGIMSESHNWTK